MWRKISIEDYRLALDTVVVVAVLVGVRELLFYVGIEGIALTSLTASVIGGGVFVMGLVIAGTLSDYKEAERTPNNLAAGLYAILREAESMHRVWKKPDLDRLRERLVAVVDALRRDIAAGDTRECQEAVENLSESFLELGRVHSSQNVFTSWNLDVSNGSANVERRAVGTYRASASGEADGQRRASGG